MSQPRRYEPSHSGPDPRLRRNGSRHGTSAGAPASGRDLATTRQHRPGCRSRAGCRNPVLLADETTRRTGETDRSTAVGGLRRAHHRQGPGRPRPHTARNPARQPSLAGTDRCDLRTDDRGRNERRAPRLRPAWGSPSVRKIARELYEGSALHLEDTDDWRGPAWGAVLKNIYAQAFGMADGLGLGDNVRGYLAVAAMNEMRALLAETRRRPRHGLTAGGARRSHHHRHQRRFAPSPARHRHRARTARRPHRRRHPHAGRVARASALQSRTIPALPVGG